MTEPAADRVSVFYDALAAFQRTHRLPSLQHAQLRGLLAEHLARAVPAAVPVPPPANRAALRERIRRVLAQSDGFDFDSLEPHDYQIQAAALLAVLPEPADRAAEIERLREEHATWRKLGKRNLQRAHEENARLRADHQAALERIREAVCRLAAHAVGFQDVLDDSDRGPWAKTVGADIAELRRLAAEAQQDGEAR